MGRFRKGSEALIKQELLSSLSRFIIMQSSTESSVKKQGVASPRGAHFPLSLKPAYKAHPFDSFIFGTVLVLSLPTGHRVPQLRIHVDLCRPHSHGSCPRIGCTFAFHFVYIFFASSFTLISKLLEHALDTRFSWLIFFRK